MALTWRVTDIENHEVVTTWIPDHDDVNGRYKAGDKLWAPITEALVWHSLNTGIGKITTANAAEVYARISLVETLYGPSLRNADGERPVTYDDVIDHIGLSTNASYKDESRSSFLKRHCASKLDDGVRNFERHVERKLAESKTG